MEHSLVGELVHLEILLGKQKVDNLVLEMVRYLDGLIPHWLMSDSAKMYLKKK